MQTWSIFHTQIHTQLYGFTICVFSLIIDCVNISAVIHHLAIFHIAYRNPKFTKYFCC